MAIQHKVGTSLNESRWQKLRAIVLDTPLACPSSVLAVALDLLHAEWLRRGCDLKAVIGAIGATVLPAGGAA